MGKRPLWRRVGTAAVAVLTVPTVAGAGAVVDFAVRNSGSELPPNTAAPLRDWDIEEFSEGLGNATVNIDKNRTLAATDGPSETVVGVEVGQIKKTTAQQGAAPPLAPGVQQTFDSLVQYLYANARDVYPSSDFFLRASKAGPSGKTAIDYINEAIARPESDYPKEIGKLEFIKGLVTDLSTGQIHNAVKLCGPTTVTTTALLRRSPDAYTRVAVELVSSARAAKTVTGNLALASGDKLTHFRENQFTASSWVVVVSLLEDANGRHTFNLDNGTQTLPGLSFVSRLGVIDVPGSEIDSIGLPGTFPGELERMAQRVTGIEMQSKLYLPGSSDDGIREFLLRQGSLDATSPYVGLSFVALADDVSPLHWVGVGTVVDGEHGKEVTVIDTNGASTLTAPIGDLVKHVVAAVSPSAVFENRLVSKSVSDEELLKQLNSVVRRDEQREAISAYTSDPGVMRALRSLMIDPIYPTFERKEVVWHAVDILASGRDKKRVAESLTLYAQGVAATPSEGFAPTNVDWRVLRTLASTLREPHDLMWLFNAYASSADPITALRLLSALKSGGEWRRDELTVVLEHTVTSGDSTLLVAWLDFLDGSTNEHPSAVSPTPNTASWIEEEVANNAFQADGPNAVAVLRLHAALRLPFSYLGQETQLNTQTPTGTSTIDFEEVFTNYTAALFDALARASVNDEAQQEQVDDLALLLNDRRFTDQLVAVFGKLLFEPSGENQPPPIERFVEAARLLSERGMWNYPIELLSYDSRQPDQRTETLLSMQRRAEDAIEVLRDPRVPSLIPRPQGDSIGFETWVRLGHTLMGLEPSALQALRTLSERLAPYDLGPSSNQRLLEFADSLSDDEGHTLLTGSTLSRLLQILEEHPDMKVKDWYLSPNLTSGLSRLAEVIFYGESLGFSRAQSIDLLVQSLNQDENTYPQAVKQQILQTHIGRLTDTKETRDLKTLAQRMTEENYLENRNIFDAINLLIDPRPEVQQLLAMPVSGNGSFRDVIFNATPQGLKLAGTLRSELEDSVADPAGIVERWAPRFSEQKAG